MTPEKGLCVKKQERKNPAVLQSTRQKRKRIHGGVQLKTGRENKKNSGVDPWKRGCKSARPPIEKNKKKDEELQGDLRKRGKDPRPPLRKGGKGGVKSRGTKGTPKTKRKGTG